MNKNIIAAIVLVTITSTCIAQRPTKKTPKEAMEKPVTATTLNQLTPAEKAAGWKLLFDGTSTNGWHTYGSKTIGNAWKVSNGNLFLDADTKEDGVTGGDIVTDDEYGNFELQLDWKISKNGNSGICLYAIDDKDKYKYMWYTAPEMQILDNDGHPDGKIIKHRAGDLYDLISSSSEPVKAVGEWNHVLIKSLNGKLDSYLNGVHIIDTRIGDDNWRALVAGSKFKDLPDFAKSKTGHIGLQDHGNTVSYRNIKIRKL